jgi:hypothetical protein
MWETGYENHMLEEFWITPSDLDYDWRDFQESIIVHLYDRMSFKLAVYFKNKITRVLQTRFWALVALSKEHKERNQEDPGRPWLGDALGSPVPLPVSPKGSYGV